MGLHDEKRKKKYICDCRYYGKGVGKATKIVAEAGPLSYDGGVRIIVVEIA